MAVAAVANLSCETAHTPGPMDACQIALLLLSRSVHVNTFA